MFHRQLTTLQSKKTALSERRPFHHQCDGTRFLCVVKVIILAVALDFYSFPRSLYEEVCPSKQL